MAQPVDNLCAITILQHPRERHHPIGTARLVRLALRHSEIAVCWQLLAPAHLSARTTSEWGVLFPSVDAVDLSEFNGAQNFQPGAAAPGAKGLPQRPTELKTKPKRLIVLDGTWAHARCLYRHNRWLWRLPHYRITPEGQDRYRIRREPKAEYTSTLEAVVTALLHLEPQTAGLKQVLGAFDTMIDRQVACIETLHQGARRRLRPRSRPRSRGIPQTLIEAPERTIVVFVEFMQHTENDKTSREMVYLTAEHVQSGQSFAHFVQPQRSGPSERHLAHMQLRAEQVAQDALPQERVAELWAAFAGPAPQILAWNQASLDMLTQLGTPSGASFLLKAMFAAAHRTRGGTLGDAVIKAQLTVVPASALGRAAVRLGSAVAVAKYLMARAQSDSKL